MKTLIAATWVALILLATLLTAQELRPVASDSLVGLWKARRWFGPYVRGPLVIQRSGGNYIAYIAGEALPLRAENDEIVFDLPNDEGSFRGKVEGGDGIRGRWMCPPHSTSGFHFVVPVRLASDGPNRWSGQVIPYDDEFTLYLKVTKQADGSLAAMLRNPDRDLGTQISVKRLTLENGVVRLFGQVKGQAEREVSSGPYDGDRGAFTLTFPDRGGSYDFTRDTDSSNFYPRGKNPPSYTYRPPLALDDGWKVGTLDEANISRAGMEKFVEDTQTMPMDSPDSPQVHAILVARHGKLVFEEYFHGENGDKLHDTRSASKSVTALIVGAAIQSGAPLKLSSLVYKVMNGGSFPADLEPRKKDMTLENLLTMSSGYFCDDTDPKAPGNEETMLDQADEADYYKYTLKVPMITEPGEKAVYCSANPNLALGVIGHATGKHPMQIFDRLIAQPMKIDRYAWANDPAGNPYGGGSMKIRSRDFLKLGQLMLNGGIWNGKQILSRDFVRKASSPLYHLRNLYYGYLWWGANLPYKNRKVYTYTAGGAGGQAVMVVPELDMVIEIFGANYSSHTAVHVQQELIPSYILPSVRETGDAKNAPVLRVDYKSPYGPSNDGSRVRP
jgi:CubicO group peptidase (beta-lactamase class C family)